MGRLTPYVIDHRRNHYCAVIGEILRGVSDEILRSSQKQHHLQTTPKNKKIMKTKIYIVTFTSYTESDNYLHNDAQTFTNRLFAQDYYEKLCDNARENANELYVETNDGDGEDWSDTVQGEHHNEDKNNRRYTISREPGTEFGYQVEVKLQEVEIDVPRAIETAHKVGDEIVWEKYGEDHKGRVTDIDLFISTDKGEHYQHAVYRTTESETGERWYVNEEDIIE